MQVPAAAAPSRSRVDLQLGGDALGAPALPRAPPPPRRREGDPRATCWFRSNDAPENLVLSVALKKIADGAVPLGSRAALRSPAEFRRGAFAFPPPTETKIRWQQKVFSHRELLRYAGASGGGAPPDPTPLEMRYRGEVAALLARGGDSAEAKIVAAGPEGELPPDAAMRIFTYTDQDGYVERGDSEETGSTSALPLSAMARRTLDARHRKRLAPEQTRISGKDMVTDTPVHLRQPAVSVPFSEMHIMAGVPVAPAGEARALPGVFPGDALPGELRRPGEETVSGSSSIVETRLCTIRIYTSGAISVTPGLSNDRQVYRFRVGRTDVYEYEITTDSTGLTAVEAQKEQEIFESVLRRRKQATEQAVGLDFRSVADACRLQMNVFGEIASAYGFEKDKIQIQYLLELPGGWAACGRQSTTGAYTQSSSCRWDGGLGSRVAHFGLPIDAQVWVRGRAEEPPPDGGAARGARWPKIYFEVSSADVWDRHTVEGYGYMDLPRAPGSYELDVSTWRPFGTPEMRLRKFFIGGSPELEDISYTAVPAGYNKSRLNKVGFQTVSSGVIRVRLNVVFQTARASRGKDHVPPQHGPATGREGSGQGSLHSISETLVRARTRLEALRSERKEQ